MTNKSIEAADTHGEWNDISDHQLSATVPCFRAELIAAFSFFVLPPAIFTSANLPNRSRYAA